MESFPCGKSLKKLHMDLPAAENTVFVSLMRMKMRRKDLPSENTAFIALLRACTKSKDLHKGIRVHADLLKRGLLEKSFYALVSMYAKCGAPAKARELLNRLRVQDVVSWTEVISGFAQQGQGEEALKCFEQMQREGLSPNAVTYACILKVCGSEGAIVKGEQIHDQISRQGLLGNNIILGTALVDMYAKFGALVKARRVLEELPVRDVFTWTALIGGYAQQDQGEEALNCFELMQSEGILPNAVTFLCVLKACGSIRAADKGAQIHDEISKQGLLGSNIMLGSALVDMYARCGTFEKAQQVLEELPAQNVVSWSALIAGYAQQGQGEKALNCFELMQYKGFAPNVVTFVCVLKACGSIGAADKGEQIHGEIARRGLLGNDIVLGSALVDMYAKCGALAKARQVLEELPALGVVAWSALIAVYAQQGRGEEAIECFERMQFKGIAPNAVTFTCILKACGSIGAASKGEQIHDELARQGLLGDNTVLGTALLDMYVKCGALSKAQQVLSELPAQDVVSWTALIAGYARQGKIQEAFNCFEQMQRAGFSPNAVTFSCLLYACSHSGLIDEGQMFFTNMSTNYGTKASAAHFSSMADIFGRAGHLDKAIAVIEKMPSSEHPVAWSALLSACRNSGDALVGRWAFEHAAQVEKSNAAVYVAMANIYEAAGMQGKTELIEATRGK